MDLRQLLGKLDLIEGSMKAAEKHPTGPKFTGQWKGTDKGTPGRKLVGDSVEPEESILKDLSKGPTPKTREQELAEQFEQFLQQLEEENLGVEEKRPSRKGSRPQRDYGKTGEPSKRYTPVNEHGDQEDYEPWGSQDLEPGEKALIGKPIKTKAVSNLAKDALNTAFGGSAKDLTKNLSIRKDIDEDKEFNYNVTCDGYDKGDFVSKDDAIASAQHMIYGGEKEYTQIEVTDLTTNKVIWKWHGKKDVDETRGHKIIARKLKDIELAKKPVSDEEYAKHVERMKASQKEYLKKNPNSIYKQVDETVPTGQQTMAQTTGQNDPKQAAATNQALQTLKAGTQSNAPAPMLAKALDAASQGKPVGQQDMKALEPMMKDLTTVAQDPKLANQFKTLAQQIQQVQKKQQTPQSS